MQAGRHDEASHLLDEAGAIDIDTDGARALAEAFVAKSPLTEAI
ncbi:hypothetical protein [Bradyrhizobium sp. BWA-3-5]|nr:hypothetical protein [Bradyrhizobium sp. BWA-3-5]WOH67958.1 hypothetical protein RX331_09645 [Bradyrhizobium sp. BWA-3-5]